GAGVLAGQGDLQGAYAVKPDLSGLVDDAHPAAAQLGEELAARDVREGVRRRTRRAPQPRAVPSGSRLEGLRVRPANDVEPSGEPSEDRVDQSCVPGQPTSILRGLGRLPESDAIVKLDVQEVTEQPGMVRVGCTAQEVFDPWTIARAPGGLEPI